MNRADKTAYINAMDYKEGFIVREEEEVVVKGMKAVGVEGWGL